MSSQAQVNALEHLLMEVLKSNQMSLTSFKVFEKARESALGSNGSGGPEQKQKAAEYIDHLKLQL